MLGSLHHLHRGGDDRAGSRMSAPWAPPATGRGPRFRSACIAATGLKTGTPRAREETSIEYRTATDEPCRTLSFPCRHAQDRIDVHARRPSTGPTDGCSHLFRPSATRRTTWCLRFAVSPKRPQDLPEIQGCGPRGPTALPRDRAEHASRQSRCRDAGWRCSVGRRHHPVGRSRADACLGAMARCGGMSVLSLAILVRPGSRSASTCGRRWTRCSWAATLAQQPRAPMRLSACPSVPPALLAGNASVAGPRSCRAIGTPPVTAPATTTPPHAA